MARGWESKSVESQIETAEALTARRAEPLQTAEQIRLERERESLELSRTRVLHDMATAMNPKYRAMLERSLVFLDEKLKGLAG